jgi:hypothetical protein
MGKAAFNKRKALFSSKLDLHTTRKKTSKVLNLEHRILWCQNLHTSESRTEIPGKFPDMVLEKNGEDQLD